MLRFIVLSLAMHGLAVGVWYQQETRPEAISGGRTLALVLLPSAATAPHSSTKTPLEQAALNTARAARQASPPVKQLTAPVPADVQPQLLHARTGSTAAPAPEATVETAETTDHESASAAPAATTPAVDDSPARHAVQTAVSTAIKANFRYPRIARRNGWEGTVMLALRVLPDGQLTDILVSSSSGHPVLDRAALHSLQTARVPQATQWLSDQAVELVLPVEYRLLDS